MVQRNYMMDILTENATTFSDKAKLNMLTEAEQAVINNKMIGNIYQSTLKKRDIDFDNIPLTKGDIQKFNGYDNIMGTLSTLKQLSSKFGIKIEEINIIETAVSNIRVYKSVFERGFALDKDFLIMYYNSLVYTCVESTSLVLSSYVEYVKTVNSIEFTLKKGKGIAGNVCINNLKKFNQSVKTGEFSKFANAMLDKNKQNFVGGTAATIAIGLAVAIVPIARELIYYAYESRMNISEFLEQQAAFLEMNKVRLNSSDMEARQRNSVLAKQGEVIKKLEKYADRVRVNHKLSNKNATNKIKQDNKAWTINSVEDDISGGFSFI